MWNLITTLILFVTLLPTFISSADISSVAFDSSNPEYASSDDWIPPTLQQDPSTYVDDGAVEESDLYPEVQRNNVAIPPIFVLNLDRSKERWRKVSGQMARAGLTVTRLPAVDGRKLSRLELLSQSTRLAEYLQPRGVIGCYLSHRKFWQMVVDNEYPAAIVFEDDVQLVEGFRDKLLDSLKSLPDEEKFDVILLGAIGRVHPEGKDNVGSYLFARYMGGNRPLRRITPQLYQPKRPAGTHAYMVSLEGARKLLQLCPKASYHVDIDAWRHRDLQIRLFQPMLAFQTFDESELTDLPQYRTGLNKMLVDSRPMQRVQSWAQDPYTLQPWSHALAEPILQFGLKGPVVTVERHVIIIGGGCALAVFLQQIGLKVWARAVLGTVVGFTVTVRSLVWLLMNWR